MLGAEGGYARGLVGMTGNGQPPAGDRTQIIRS
jgi:hypothetical protein